ncbi:ABC-2 type transport system ATP-binding protein [Anseongella ginsenosidimutans]|uniref:ABC-2 type transport system ATP-binding protein n=1 Tax=Anseongella ginsenosidimutans TaxID=496056 RepID=A0A4R3KVI0_9SPHI|nr:ATP-binding cassette domain-containing protein [Anseongella ginsenosidimutans]QEC51738.1 ATP-binding cassette domain-containing protein [Anseongella ginsenosidimutans]TCS89101.1 ABC-2 type transport system ATP-binding protein [Anseongella ginsenosidimutans]
MITIEDLYFSYRRKKVICGLNLRLEAGHIYGLMGANGTGKSTLLRCIAGLLFPEHGRMKVLSHRPKERHPALLRQLFIIPEEFYLPDVRIGQFVRYNAPFYPSFSKEQFDSCLEDFGVPYGNTLLKMSYGQKKKVLISFALACNTPLLLMDEPTNGLDITGKRQFRKLIAGTATDERCIVISTHQVKDLDNLIDHILILEEGRMLLDEPAERISRRLQFKISFDREEIETALYSEDSLKGSAIVTSNPDGQEGQFDLELLYNAVTSNKEGVLALFNEEIIQETLS